MSASQTTKRKFQNEELSYNPFSDLVGKVSPSDEACSEENHSLSSLSEDTGPHEINPGRLLPLKSVISMRIERKGRGGKTVTVVMISPDPGKDRLKDLLRSLKRFLGCGASMENNFLCIQGDQRNRIAEWFYSHGIHNIKV